ncbi:ScbR family autoregulator-binding transcription factor [Phycicoccus flavus]|uniref:TetR/AcrR family transcriptional regulator n=1 Tax=Phycicoccus flavus TaxID=2502783 RepID=A0A8T6R8Y7_9MICO|nr:ScbR family autoregulator-binding transcription factor [Phycicoccus flavus]NHA70164.1 TetR/AcrR family transcriptional regulator [Phycicoccus flavus]
MPQQQRAIATRRAALEGAAAVIERHGYDAATINLMVRESGVTKGALYFHFSSKEAIAEAIIAEQGAWLDRRTDPGVPPLQCVVDLSYAFVEALLTDPLMRASIRMTVNRAGSPDSVVGGYRTWIDGVAALLRQARDEGALAPGVDPEAAAYVVCASMTGLQLTSETLTGRADLEERVESMWRLLVPGLVGTGDVRDVDVRPPSTRAVDPG